jgi:DNA (cytosine-5)-methyltransferase 1
MILDLFAGPGGWDEGLRAIGRTDVLGIEWDANACDTAEAAGHKRYQRDVRTVDPLDFADVEGIVASPPCQPFSENGKRLGIEDSRGDLIYEPLRFVQALRPRWVAFEQVKMALPFWQDQLPRLRAMGYSAWAGVIDAANYGVPQNRLRAVLVARLDGPTADLPPETHGRLRWVSQREVLGWPRDWFVNTGLDWKKGQPREAAQKIPGSRPAATITTRSVGQWRVYTNATDYRGLTEQEAATLQTFPADYPWQGATQLARATQIGNAIPPVLAAHILAALDVGRLEVAA